MDSGAVLFESFLFKTPPLDKLIVNWKKRWFVLRKKDPFDSASIELVYYGDPGKKEIKGIIPVHKLTKVYHTPTKSKQEHVFAVETSDKKDKKFLLKATEHNTKSIWIAKLTELISRGDQFHVTVPHQPCAQFSEAIANSSLPTKIDVTCPSTDASIMEIQFQHLRRFGYEVAFDVDMVWFESCNCKSKEHDGTFHFFLVASGIEAAQHIVMEVKRKIETCTRTHLIQEQSDGIQLSFISRGHYGCTPYPPSSRMMIVQTGLTSLQSSWGRMPGLTSLQSSWGGRMPGLGGPERKMSAIPPGSASWTFSPGALATNHLRRNTVQPLLSARSPSPLPPPLDTPPLLRQSLLPHILRALQPTQRQPYMNFVVDHTRAPPQKATPQIPVYPSTSLILQDLHHLFTQPGKQRWGICIKEIGALTTAAIERTLSLSRPESH